MEYIVLGLKAVQRGAASPILIDVAAVWVDRTGREGGFFQSYVNPGVQELAEACPKTFQAIKAEVSDLGKVPQAAEAAEGLRAFLEAHPQASVHAFSLDRARRMLGVAPWSLEGRWGLDIRRMVQELMADEEGLDYDAKEIQSLKLADAAGYLKIQMPLEHMALLDARLIAQIFGKITGMQDRMGVSDRESLREAIYLMEDGF